MEFITSGTAIMAFLTVGIGLIGTVYGLTQHRSKKNSDAIATLRTRVAANERKLEKVDSLKTNVQDHDKRLRRVEEGINSVTHIQKDVGELNRHLKDISAVTHRTDGSLSQISTAIAEINKHLMGTSDKK